MKEFNSSKGINRGFCGNCGSGITYENDKHPNEIDICLVTMDDANQLKPEYHIWISDKLPWIKLDDGLPQYQEWRNN